MRKLEICCGGINSIVYAIKGGADRIELCSALEVGGLTPSIGLIRTAVSLRDAQCKGGKDVKIHVLIRPRSGDFAYDKSELSVMLADVAAAKEAGADGVVIGALTPDGDIDKNAVVQMVDIAEGMDVTFHRAFDMCRNPQKAMAEIARLGCNRILTSGCAPTAEDGIPTLKELVDTAPNSLKIMAGCGISPINVRKIIDSTGITEIHASAKIHVPSIMVYKRCDVKMGANEIDEYSTLCTSEATVRELARLIAL